MKGESVIPVEIPKITMSSMVESFHQRDLEQFLEDITPHEHPIR